MKVKYQLLKDHNILMYDSTGILKVSFSKFIKSQKGKYLFCFLLLGEVH